MSDTVYEKLAKVLDTLPNGFPATESGVEIKLLKKVFSPEDAEIFCDMRLSFETVEDIAVRTGRALQGLEETLIKMSDKGQLFMVTLEGSRIFKMVPWVFGIFEFQLPHMDREFAVLNEEYGPIFGKQFWNGTPSLMQTLPIEEEVSIDQQALPFEKVSTIVETSESFKVMECVCKKEKVLVDEPCDNPLEVCMAFAPVPGVFDDTTNGRAINKEEAKAILKQAEDAGLVHLTSNFQNGHFFICNCCGCCCGVLRGINDLGIPANSVINSHYYAVTNTDECSACGECADERCQVNAIEERDDYYEIIKEDCIGCGLCITTCPTEAIRLVRKEEKNIKIPPLDETDWFKMRGARRGVDFAKYQ